MAPSNTLLVVGLLLALGGVGRLLVDASRNDGRRRFVGYLVALLLSLVGIGFLLASAL